MSIENGICPKCHEEALMEAEDMWVCFECWHEIKIVKAVKAVKAVNKPTSIDDLIVAKFNGRKLELINALKVYADLVVELYGKNDSEYTYTLRKIAEAEASLI